MRAAAADARSSGGGEGGGKAPAQALELESQSLLAAHPALWPAAAPDAPADWWRTPWPRALRNPWLCLVRSVSAELVQESKKQASAATRLLT